MGLFFSSVNHIVKLTNDKCTAVIYCRVCILCFYTYVRLYLFVCLVNVCMCSTCVMGCALNNNTDDVIVIVIGTRGRCERDKETADGRAKLRKLENIM